VAPTACERHVAAIFTPFQPLVRPELPELPRKHLTKSGSHPRVVRERSIVLGQILDAIWHDPKGARKSGAMRKFLEPSIDTRAGA